jgi:hypothetical protein
MCTCPVLSKDFLCMQTYFLNIMLAPYTLLTSNEFQTLRHHSQAKSNHTGQFFVSPRSQFTCQRSALPHDRLAVFYTRPLRGEIRCRIKLFDTRRAVTSLFVFMDHNTAKTLRPMFVNTFSKAKVNTRCYRFKSRGCDGLSLACISKPFLWRKYLYFLGQTAQNWRRHITEVSTVLPAPLW